MIKEPTGLRRFIKLFQVPNTTITYIAQLIANHGNKVQRNFFHPNEGRLAHSHKNIALSKNKEPIFEITLQQNVGSDDHDINRTSSLNEHYAFLLVPRVKY